MVDVNDIKKGDRFHIVTNGSIAKILSIHHTSGVLDGFMVEVTPANGKEFIVPMTAEYYIEKMERFKKIVE